MPLHSALTGSDLHEPKGVAAAAVDRVYVSDGAGSGTWQKIESDQIDTASIFNTNKGCFYLNIPDVTVADAFHIVFPFAATVTRVTSVIAGAIATADETLTISKLGVGNLGTITIANAGSAEGDVDSLTPAANNTFTANQVLKIASGGASTGTRRCGITVEYTRTS